jgi:bis(5'-nucleosidyl)-tetraphosphatase
MRDKATECSYGIVPLKKRQQGWAVFMICHKSGHWTLPKGHPEAKETALECAKRELYEETQLQVKTLLRDEPFREDYQFFRKEVLVEKHVLYFIAEVEGIEVLQEEEIQDGKWASLEEAPAMATYPEMQKLLKKVYTFLKTC